MKEILGLQARAITHAPQLADGDGIDFSREEIGGEIGLLSAELHAEIDALQRTLNVAVPEDFDYYVFIGGEEGSFFGLNFGRMPVGPSDWNPERSIIDQLRSVDWEEARKEGEGRGAMLETVSLLDRVLRTLPSAKSLQRDYRETARDFVRDKRRDAGKVHVLYLRGEDELMEVAFEDGSAFREMLPGMIGRGEDVFAVVAYGKPLPVEKIDALNAQAQRTLKERLKERSEEAARKAAEEEPTPGVIDIEVEQQSS